MNKKTNLLISLLIALLFTGCTQASANDYPTIIEKNESDYPVVGYVIDDSTNDDLALSDAYEEEITDTAALNKEDKSTSTQVSFDYSQVPKYSGCAYYIVNDNIPFFTEKEIERGYDNFIELSPLDSLGRCGSNMESISNDSLPTQERGEIGSVKPSGWFQAKYSEVIDSSPAYLMNRCHLLSYASSGLNAEEKNLITGTRYLNMNGMYAPETLITNYVRDNNDKHLLYRVTPIFEGKELLARGVLLEGLSVEDNGASVSFNMFCYNVQPGVDLNYSNGKSSLNKEDLSYVEYPSLLTKGTYQRYKLPATAVKMPQDTVTSNSNENTNSVRKEPVDGSSVKDYAVNQKNGKLHITGKCDATNLDFEYHMTSPAYFSTYDDAYAYAKTICSDSGKIECYYCFK